MAALNGESLLDLTLTFLWGTNYCKLLLHFDVLIPFDIFDVYLCAVQHGVNLFTNVDPDNLQGSHRLMSFMRIKYITRANELP